MESLWQDLRHAGRNLTKSPGFTLVVLLTLALGIGANTALFTVVKSVLLEPLAFPEPEQLVLVREKNVEKGFPQFALSPLNFRDYHSQNEVFESMAAYSTKRMALTGDGAPRRVAARRVTGDYFRVFRVEPVLGRTITPEDDHPEAPRVAVLGHDFWESRFGGDPAVLTTSLKLDGESYAVVGVVPPSISSLHDIFVPLSLDYESTGRGGHWLRSFARLRDGVSLEQARAHLDAIAKSLEQAYPGSNTGWGARVDPLHDWVVEDVKTALLLLLIAVGLVLLVACANVANLSLSRMVRREKELALRTALGASRGRLIRQMLTESTLLALAGGALGLAFALLGTDALLALAAGQLPRSSEIAIDGGVLAFSLALALFTGLACGLLPALRASRTDVQGSLKEGGGGQVGVGGPRLRDLLVRAEVAVALVLLIGAGLLLRSFQQLLDVDPGFVPHGKLIASMELPDARYPEDALRVVFYRQLFERLEGLPGVETAAAVYPAPLTGQDFVLTFYIEGRPRPEPNQEPVSNVRTASSDYFVAMGIPLEQGRAIRATDDENTEKVVVINRSAAARYWPEENPLGARLTFDDPAEEDADYWRIIGVVGDVRHRSLEGETDPEIYCPILQAPMETANLVLKTTGDPMSLVGSLRDEVAALDPEIPLASIRTVDELIENAVAQPRFNSLLLGLFAGVAMLLAALGVYGLISYSVSHRLREIGVRLALGADRRSVLGLVFRQGMIPVLVGVGLGIGGALAGTQLLRSLVYDMSPTDPATFITTVALLVSVGALACLIPALRAMRVDPILALRGVDA